MAIPQFNPTPHYAALLKHLSISPDTIFADPRITVSRKLTDRENGILQAPGPDARPIKLHIKRYASIQSGPSPAQTEAQGIQLLTDAAIPTVPLVAWGILGDGRSFLITEDLAGHAPADKLIERGLPFTQLLIPTANLAASLHEHGLHHRDLYLCHFFAAIGSATMADAGTAPTEFRLIDAARVRPLPAFFAQRWIIKDLAQFWYSAMQLSIPLEQRRRWLEVYAAGRSPGLPTRDVDVLQARIQRKADWIGRHDAALRRKQPQRNVSIPQ